MLLLLPIVWAVLSATLAIWLYNTSAGFFEHEVESELSRHHDAPQGNGQHSERRKRRTSLRLAGSAVIAGVVFGGLLYATQSLIDSDSVRVRRVELTKMQELAKVAAGLLGDSVVSCVANRSAGQCKDELERAHLSSVELQGLLSRIQ
jgi:hypothetical protein